MKKFMVTGAAVCAVLLLLGFSACDASLDPSDSGDSAISQPRGQLTITGITVAFTAVYVFPPSKTLEYNDNLSDCVAIGTGSGTGAATVTISLQKPVGGAWDGSGSYRVFLLVNSTPDPSGEWGSYGTISFNKGSASVNFSAFTSVQRPSDDDDE